MTQSNRVVRKDVHQISGEEVVFNLEELQKSAHTAVVLALRNVQHDVRATHNALDHLSGERNLIKARSRAESLVEHSQLLYRSILSLHALEEARTRDSITFEKGE